MFYKLCRPFIEMFIHLVFRPTIEGRENIPSDGPLILAGNHTDYLDCLLIISAIKKPVHFLGKHTLFEGIKGYFVKAMKVIPVDRTKSKNEEAKRASLEVLKAREILGIFPEGTINRSSRTILPFKMGAVYFSHKTASPIVPFVIEGKFVPFKTSIKITFLPPMSAEDDDLEMENWRLMNTISEKLEGKM